MTNIILAVYLSTVVTSGIFLVRFSWNVFRAMRMTYHRIDFQWGRGWIPTILLTVLPIFCPVLNVAVMYILLSREDEMIAQALNAMEIFRKEHEK